MKKLVLASAVLTAITMVSCMSDSNTSSQADTAIDSVAQTVDSAMHVTGVAVDGAMNSVCLKVGEDTLEFTYPDLDSEHRDAWNINDTLTVQYFSTENGDSVTSVINENA